MVFWMTQLRMTSNLERLSRLGDALSKHVAASINGEATGRNKLVMN